MAIFWFRMGLNSKRLGCLSHHFYNNFLSSSGAMISFNRTCNYLIPKKLSLSTTSLPQSCVALQLQPQQFGSVRFFAAPSWAKKPQDKDAKVIRINEEITAQYVRLVTDEGHEVITRRDALYRAKSLELDLVEVGSKADPPVCKIMDFNKEKFKKVARDKGLAKTRAESSIRIGVCKEVHFTGKIEQKDLEMKADTVKRIMERGYRVKIVAEPVKKQAEVSDAEREDLRSLLSCLYSLIEDISFVESPLRAEKRVVYMIVRHAKFGTKKNPSKKVSKLNEEKENDVHAESGNLDPHHSRHPMAVLANSSPGMNSYPNQRNAPQSPVGTIDTMREYKNDQIDLPVSNTPSTIPLPAVKNRYQMNAPPKGGYNVGSSSAQAMLDRRQNNGQFVPGDLKFRGRNPSQLPSHDNGQLGSRQRQFAPGEPNFRGKNPSQLPPQDNGQFGSRQRQFVSGDQNFSGKNPVPPQDIGQMGSRQQRQFSPGDPNSRRRNPSQLPPTSDYIRRQGNGHLGTKLPSSSLPPHDGPSTTPKKRFGMFSSPNGTDFDDQE